MSRDIRVGDRVKLLGMPESLIHDLPVSEQEEMRNFVGKCTIVEDIDAYGYFWISYSNPSTDPTQCSGHSFAITSEFLQVLPQER